MPYHCWPACSHVCIRSGQQCRTPIGVGNDGCGAFDRRKADAKFALASLRRAANGAGVQKCRSPTASHNIRPAKKQHSSRRNAPIPPALLRRVSAFVARSVASRVRLRLARAVVTSRPAAGRRKKGHATDGPTWVAKLSSAARRATPGGRPSKNSAVASFVTNTSTGARTHPHAAAMQVGDGRGQHNPGQCALHARLNNAARASRMRGPRSAAMRDRCCCTEKADDRVSNVARDGLNREKDEAKTIRSGGQTCDRPTAFVVRVSILIRSDGRVEMDVHRRKAGGFCLYNSFKGCRRHTSISSERCPIQLFSLSLTRISS